MHEQLPHATTLACTAISKAAQETHQSLSLWSAALDMQRQLWLLVG